MMLTVTRRYSCRKERGLQKQVEALEQRLFFSGPFKSSAVAAEDTAARKATSKSR